MNNNTPLFKKDQSAQVNFQSKDGTGGSLKRKSFGTVTLTQITTSIIAYIDNEGSYQPANEPFINAISSINYKCDVCGIILAHLNALNQHIRTHLQPTYMVAVDPALFQARNVVHEGLQTVTMESLDANKLQASDITFEETEDPASALEKVQCLSCGLFMIVSCNRMNNFKCDKCIQIHSTEEVVEHQVRTPTLQLGFREPVEHQLEIQGVVNENEATKDSSRKTDDLDKQSHDVDISTSSTPHELNGNVVDSKAETDEAPKRFVCDICDCPFSKYNSMWAHKQLHSGVKKYVCDTCGVAFAKSTYLNSHVKTHLGEKPFKCKVCGKRFTQASHLKNHERVHSGEKPFVCAVCDKAFTRYSTLWSHRRMHTGENPYKCGVCGLTFKQRTHLRDHESVHSGDKLFKCDVCSAIFESSFALKRHQRTHK